MTDPAVEAARDYVNRVFGEPRFIGQSAARKALKPIRELHRVIVGRGAGRICSSCYAPSGRSVAWPCNTAKLIYTTEELER